MLESFIVTPIPPPPHSSSFIFFPLQVNMTGDSELPGVSISVCRGLIHHTWCFSMVLPASHVSQLISPLRPHLHPNTIPCELLLRCKVTAPIPHVIKNSGTRSICGLYLLKSLKVNCIAYSPFPSVPRHSFLLGGSSNELLAQLGRMQKVLILT